MTAINGVPYPYSVKDQESLCQWISSIDRNVSDGPATSVATPKDAGGYTEVLKFAYFKNGDELGQQMATALVCQEMAHRLFSHLIHAPHASLLWRARPEFDISYDTIPSDLSRSMTRDQLSRIVVVDSNLPISLKALKDRMPDGDEWAIDFSRDTIFHAAAPIGEWRIFKSYMRYAVVLDQKLVPHRMGYTFKG